MSIQESLAELRKNVSPACTLIAVSKTQPTEKIIEVYQAGQRVFGENRAQELLVKYDALPKDIEWHMIGHLQTNKVRLIAPFVHLIHSVDSPRLLEEINRQAGKSGRTIPCLLQVHIAEEETKFGFSPDDILDFLTSASCENMTHIQVKGLMGMATFTDNEAQVRKEFRGLKTFFDRLKLERLPHNTVMEILSMGMSGDYRIAIEEGSTMIRVGTAIFGKRNFG